MARILWSMAATSIFGATGYVFDGPDPKVPQMAVFKHYIGEWDTEMTVKQDSGLQGAASATGSATATWMLEGRYAKQEWSMDKTRNIPKLSGTSIMTYDSGRRRYRVWNFYSNGYMTEADGEWDESKKTMTWTGKDALSGWTTVTIADFSKPGVENWSIVAKDANGNILNETAGVNKKRN